MIGKYCWCLALASGLAAIGCAPSGSRVAQGEGRAVGSASPSENYKQTRAREALAGLRFDSGVVTLTEEASRIARPGTPAEAKAQIERAEKLRLGNDYWGAIAAYRTAVIMAPARVESYLGFGRALMAEGKVVEALASFETARKLDPRSAEIAREIAMATETFGDFARSAEAWRGVLALDSRHGEAHYRLAVASFYTNDVTGAVRHISRAEAHGFAVPPQFKELVSGKAAQTP
jgi:tetratricopeptide (TPR) repeat protein